MDSWHSRPQADLFQELDARPGGLTRRQAEERLARYGPNQLEPPRRPGLLSRVMAQMKDPMILVLLGAAGLSLAASGGRDWLDGAIILIIVAVNGVLSVTQEDHAHQALEQLLALIARTLPPTQLRMKLLIPYAQGGFLAKIRETGKIYNESYEKDGTLVDALVDLRLAGQAKDYQI